MGAEFKIDEATAEQDVSWLGARLREKSTYAGLTVVVSFLLPIAARYFPQLAGADAVAIADQISMMGIAFGGLIAIVLPENGSNS